jgi:hypothetical protein
VSLYDKNASAFHKSGDLAGAIAVQLGAIRLGDAMGLSLDEQKALENHKGVWVVVSALQKAGFDVIMLILRTMIFISGGAMIGVLTFLGNLMARSDASAQKVAAGISNGMFWFGVSLAISLIAALSAWIVSFVFAFVLAKSFFKGVNSKWRYAQWPAYLFMFGCSVASVSAFIRGMYLGFSALEKFG